GILADLSGPKIRIESFQQGKVHLQEGQPFALDIALDPQAGNEREVGCAYKDLPRDVKAGDTMLLADGFIILKVAQVVGTRIECEVLVGGELSNRKGLNKHGGGLSAPALTEKDLEDIKLAAELGVDYIAVSFARDAADVRRAQAELRKWRGTAHVVAKIERHEAIENLQQILSVADAVMVARGDLGVEMGYAELTGLQKTITAQALAANRIVITATQMMESMIVSPVPTRAEVSDVANAVLDGTDAVMLSAETASGRYPLETVQEMSRICEAAEQAEDTARDTDFSGHTYARIDQAIAMGALFTAHHLGAKAIVALTESGSTMLWMSRHRAHIPMYALTSRLATQRKLALYRNVRPLLMDSQTDRDTALDHAEAHLKKRGIVQSGDVYAITCGEPMGAPGGTNMLKICRAT
ncbi:MAG: pyruvate kinase, partial [Variovorax sp.]